MAITATQRHIALDRLLGAYGNDDLVGHLVPGLTSTQMLTALLNALGANVDPTFTTCLNTMVADAQAALTVEQTRASGLQSNITAWTVI